MIDIYEHYLDPSKPFEDAEVGSRKGVNDGRKGRRAWADNRKLIHLIGPQWVYKRPASPLNYLKGVMREGRHRLGDPAHLRVRGIFRIVAAPFSVPAIYHSPQKTSSVR